MVQRGLKKQRTKVYNALGQLSQMSQPVFQNNVEELQVTNLTYAWEEDKAIEEAKVYQLVSDRNSYRKIGTGNFWTITYTSHLSVVGRKCGNKLWCRSNVYGHQ